MGSNSSVETSSLPLASTNSADSEASRVAAALNGAAELVGRPGGWTQGVYRIGDCYCAVGAIAAATGCYAYDAEGSAEVRALAAHLGGIGMDDPAGFVIAWNDRKGRTQAEVVAALRAAAAALAARDEAGSADSQKQAEAASAAEHNPTPNQ